MVFMRMAEVLVNMLKVKSVIRLVTVYIKMFGRGFHRIGSGGGGRVGIRDGKEIGLGVGGEIGSGDRISVGKDIKGGIYVRVGDIIG